MFQKFLALFLGSKALIVAGLVVAGTTSLMVGGAVVPAFHANDEGRDFNQVTLVTPSPSPSSSAASSPALLGNTSPKHGDDKDLQSCAEAAHARNQALEDIRDAWEKARHDLNALKALALSKGLRPEQVEKVLKHAKHEIDQARHEGTKAVQELVSLKRGDDEDEDQDNDDDDKMSPGSSTVGATPKPCPTVDKTKLAAIVDLAKKAMQDAVDDAGKKLATLSPAAPKPNDHKKHDDKKKGEHEGEHQDDD